MNCFLILCLIILNDLTKHLYCFDSSDENVWQTFADNENIPKFTQNSKQLYELGKRRYEVMARQETIYGQCWQTAIQSLDTNCRQLNDETQSRLALAFANCFLERSGLKTYPCDELQDIRHCVQDMTDRAFNTYTEFFTHTQSVCFYLQSELWQQKTETTIDGLTRVSINVKNRLEDASHRLEQLNDLQELSIGSQMDLNKQIIATKDSINEFKTSSAEQQFIVKEILDRFIRLQDFVLIELSYGYSLVFFIVLMIVVYFMTTPVRTSEARLWLFVVLVLNLLAERLVATYSVDNDLVGLKTTAIIINERIWLIRKITITLMSVIFFWFAITYKNYGYVNYNILNEHTMRLNGIQNQLNQLSKTEKIIVEKNVFKKVDQLDKEYSSESDSDFTADSDYSTDGSDVTQASNDTTSTVVVTSSSNKSNDIANKENAKKSSPPIETTTPPCYSLRPRKSITYTNSGVISSNESIDDFMKRIKESEDKSKANRRKLYQKRTFFSSDDD